MGFYFAFQVVSEVVVALVEAWATEVAEEAWVAVVEAVVAVEVVAWVSSGRLSEN